MIYYIKVRLDHLKIFRDLYGEQRTIIVLNQLKQTIRLIYRDCAVIHSNKNYFFILSKNKIKNEQYRKKLLLTSFEFLINNADTCNLINSSKSGHK